MRKFWIYILTIIIWTEGFAQIGQIDYLVEDPDSTSLIIHLTGVNVKSYSSSFSPQDIFFKTNGSNRIDLNPVLDHLHTQNDLFLDLQLNTIGATIHFKNFQLVAGHNLRYVGAIQFSNELGNLATQGNAAFIGETVEIGPAFLYNHYHELYGGVGIDIGPFRIGGRIKLLAGNEYLRTEQNQMHLTTGAEAFELTLESDYRFFSSGILQYRGIDEVETDFDPGVYNSFFSDNQGIAFDFGLQYKIGSHLLLYSYIQDIGSINWTKRTDFYTKNERVTYQGVDLLDYLSDENGVSVQDSLYGLLDFNNEQGQAYTDNLPFRWNIGIVFQLSAMNNIEVAFGGQNYRIHNLLTWLVEYRHDFSRHLQISSRISGFGRSQTNVGLGLKWSIGPLIFTTNIANVAGIMDLISTRYNQIGFGLQVKM